MTKFFRRLLKIINNRFNYFLKVKLNEKKFIIPIIRNIGVEHIKRKDGYWLIYLLKSFLNTQKGTFIDIGSNVGQTLLALRSVSDDIEYIGFEPNPACVFYDRLLIKKNHLKKSQIVPVGLFSENTIMEFDIIGEADPGGSLMKELRPGYNYNEKLIVPVFSFDNIFEKLNIMNIGIIKIDVEGAELEVIKSLKHSIKKFQPLIISEVLWSHNESTLKFTNSRNIELIEIMNELDYRIYQIIKTDDMNKVKYLKPIIEFENSIYTEGNRDFCDYLFAASSFNAKI